MSPGVHSAPSAEGNGGPAPCSGGSFQSRGCFLWVWDQPLPIVSCHSLSAASVISTSQVRTKPGVFLFFTKQTFVSQKPAPSSSLSTYMRAGGGARSYSSPLTARTLTSPAWQCPRVSRRPVLSLPAESCPQRGCESSGGAPTASLHEALGGRSESRGQPRHRPVTKLGTSSSSSSVPDASSEPLDGCSWVSLDPAITRHLDQRYTHPLGE